MPRFRTIIPDNICYQKQIFNETKKQRDTSAANNGSQILINKQQ